MCGVRVSHVVGDHTALCLLRLFAQARVWNFILPVLVAEQPTAVVLKPQKKKPKPQQNCMFYSDATRGSMSAFTPLYPSGGTSKPFTLPSHLCLHSISHLLHLR